MKSLVATKLVFDFCSDYFLVFRQQVTSLFVARPPLAWQQGDRGDVILLPGFTETWVFLATIASHLNQQGFRIHVVCKLGRSTGTIADDLLSLHALLDTQDFKDVTLLAHSRGGILAKLLLDDPKYDQRIRRVINIAVPYHGSVLAQIPFRGSREMSPKSRCIQKMNLESHSNAKIINIFPEHDNEVLPNISLRLIGAKNICLPVTGHTRILESPELINVINLSIG